MNISNIHISKCGYCIIIFNSYSSIRPVIDIAVEASEPEDIWEKIESLQFENDHLKGELQETKKLYLSLQQSNDVYQKLMLEINEMVQSTSEA